MERVCVEIIFEPGLYLEKGTKLNMKKYIRGFIVNIIIGSCLGIITELALIYNIKDLIKITQNELFWILDVIIISIFSKD